VPDPFTEAWAEAVASVPKDVILLEALELRNPAFVDDADVEDTIRVVNDTIGHSLKHEAGAPMFPGEFKVYVPCPFSFSFPNIEEGKGPESNIAVDNLSDELGKYLDAAENLTQAIIARYRVYMSTDLETVSLGPFEFKIRELDENGSQIVGKATMATVQNIRFMRKIFTAKEYPSLLVGRT
jgi:hypothetical protein